MNILAVDTAGKTAAVAVLRDDVLLYEAQCNNGLTHSETLLPMIDTALKAAGLTVDDLDVLGVTNGPGSFTGLRIGLAVVKGWPCPARSLRGRLHYGCAGLRPGGRGHRHRCAGRPPWAGLLGRI
ncbi:tRNA (adenosine(37)-N6)-threonylcarbamoyltransferase complex dimerization subunit type 1 TsaB [Gemmiger formicilis]|nr:tRNA (adenosine(37)-N6)-threonylcarbamoyltransferase complex dimerization subunit type 1 TsaB [Gemmiger formicilis]